MRLVATSFSDERHEVTSPIGASAAPEAALLGDGGRASDSAGTAQSSAARYACSEYECCALPPGVASVSHSGSAFGGCCSASSPI